MKYLIDMKLLLKDYVKFERQMNSNKSYINR